jgi:hypothetical protein
MTLPFEYVNSPYRCLCGKRLVAEYGQSEVDGELVEVHHCLHCSITYQFRGRSLDLPESAPRTWMTVEQILERRLSAVDRSAA